MSNKYRPRMSKQDHELWQMLKSNREIMEQLTGLQQEAVEAGIPIKDIKHYWYKSKKYSIFAKQQGMTYEEVKDELIDQMKDYAPEYPTFEYDKDDGHLLVIDPSDIHIGKLAVAAETGEDYNIEKAVNRTIEGILGIIQKAKGFEIDEILFIVGNDALHIDTPKGTTTSGTKVDVDGMWHEAFLAAKDMYVKSIEAMMSIAKTHVLYCPSNHDFMTGFFLADVLKTWFRNSQVTFDVSINHRKYYQYHENMIEADHGDGVKAEQTPLIMASEQPTMWASSRFRYSYKHHLHHRISKDFTGVNLTVLRSPSEPDGWHHRNGFLNIPAIEGFVHHPNKGRVAQLTHYFVQ